MTDAHLRILSANPAFYQTFELTEDQTVGRRLSEIPVELWNIPALQALIVDVLPGKSSFDGYEVEYSFAHLGRRSLVLSGRLVERDDTGETVVLLAVEDVTGQRGTEAELRVLNAELEQRVAERTSELAATNRELEAFCYSVSHDLRSPLRAIEGFADELLRSYAEALDDRGRHYLTRVQTASQRMAGLIDDLLQLSRLTRSAMKRAPVDLSALVASVVDELRHAHPDRSVTVTVEPGLSAQGDPSLLRIVLENLLRNAWKFTSKLPHATIRVGRTGCDAERAFFVADDGAGFDMAHAGNLFGAFQRLHAEKEFPGNGIGLATVQRIVNRHGGQVRATGEPGRGATFFFTVSGTEGSA